MSDKVLIKRELLERLADIAEIEGQPEGAQARALLTAQPQASAAQNQCGECGFPNGAGPHCGCHGAARSAHKPQRKTWRAGNPSYLCHHCNTPLMMHDQQIYCPEGPAFASNSTAAQSAPAGERETVAYEHWKADMESYGFSGLDAFQAGAAWQRTQAAGVPDYAMVAVASAAYEREALAGATHEQAWHAALSEAIAAAPAQPAAQGYVIVPVYPTPKMLAAYMETDGAVKRWKAMVAAAKAEGVHV